MTKYFYISTKVLFNTVHKEQELNASTELRVALLNTVHKEQELNASTGIDKFSLSLWNIIVALALCRSKHIAAETEVSLVIWTPTEQHPQLRTCSKLGALKLQSFNIACWRCSSSVPLGPPIWWASCSISRAEIQNWCSYVWIACRGKCTRLASH